MNNSRYITSLLLSIIFLASSAISYAQNQIFRSFWHPVYRGERLNYCSIDNNNCGKVIANHYCRLMGYASSSEYTIAYNIGSSNYLNSKTRCKDWRCNGFKFINCTSTINNKPIPSYYYHEQLFINPRFNNYRVDFCYKKQNGCGAQAAQSFCKQIGFLKAKSFLKDQNINVTQTIGSQELCLGKGCNAFKQIICYR